MAEHTVIIFDLDGTAINSPSQKLPTPDLVQATKALTATFHVCAATGRVWSFAKPILSALELRDPCIIAGGTTICDPGSGKVLWQKPISPEALREVVAILRQYPRHKILANDYAEDDYLYGGILPLSFDPPGEVYFLEQIFVPDHEAVAVAKKLDAVDGVTCVSVVAQKDGFTDLHITHNQATKEHAIQVLLTMLGVNKENTIGVGDGYNDLHLFAGVNHKVAMGNAVTELKAVADEVIGNVRDDGLTAYFRGVRAASS